MHCLKKGTKESINVEFSDKKVGKHQTKDDKCDILFICNKYFNCCKIILPINMGLTIEQIIEATGLTKEEIQTIKQK